MCLNGWGGRLHDRIIPYLRTSAPDVLCLQEVIHTPASKEAWLIYRDGEQDLPQRANFFDEVRSVLPDHAAFFCPAAQGDLWDAGGTVPSQWGLATFVHNAFPVIGQIQGFVHGSFSPDGYGDHPRSRVAHAVQLYDFERNSTVSIVHLHGLRDLGGKMDTPERLAQAHRLLDLAGAITGQDTKERLVVCGDFNVLPESETFAILAQYDLNDLVVPNGFDGTRTSQYRKSGRHADYMLVNAAVDVRSFEVVAEPEVSDHRPLVLEI